MKRTSLFLSEPQLERLRAASHSTGLPVAEIVRRALDSYLTPSPAERKRRSA